MRARKDLVGEDYTLCIPIKLVFLIPVPGWVKKDNSMMKVPVVLEVELPMKYVLLLTTGGRGMTSA